MERGRPHAGRVQGRRSDGERRRSAILGEAARLATVEGIDGLSIGRLADAVGMSKSGLFAHFGSKEDLQLATIDAATDIFDAQVLAPAAAGTSALERLRLLTEGYLRYIESDVFPGGCFFASVLSEMDTQPGPVRDRLVAFLGDWLALLDADEDPAQLTFEIEAALFLANAQFVVAHAPAPIERARRAIRRRIDGAVVRP